jgi:hypothetical protein
MSETDGTQREIRTPLEHFIRASEILRSLERIPTRSGDGVTLGLEALTHAVLSLRRQEPEFIIAPESSFRGTGEDDDRP